MSRSPLVTLFLLLLGPLAVLAALEEGLHTERFYALMRSTTTRWSTDHVKATLYAADPSPAAVVMGNSVATQAVDEERLGAELRGVAFNLGVHAAEPAQSAMLLPRVEALQPGVVVLVLGPFDMAGDPEPADLDLFDPAIARALGRPAGFDEYLAWASRLADHRDRLRSWLLEGTAPAMDVRSRKGLPRKRWAESVAHVNAQVARRRHRLSDEHPAIELFATRLSERGIRFVLAPGPVHPDVDVRYQRVAAERLARRLGVELYLPSEPYSQEDFSDPFHLLETGRNRYTRDLGRWLGRR